MFKVTDDRPGKVSRTNTMRIGHNAVHRFSVVSAVAMLMTYAATATAQSKPQAVLSNGPHAKIQATVKQSADLAQEITIPFGGDTVLDLNVPLVRTSVTQPEIVSLQLVTPRQVVLTGKAIGSTVVVLADESGENLTLNVVIEPQELQHIRKAIGEAADGAGVTVNLVRDSIVLTGTVAEVDTIERVVDIASIFAGEDKVKNQLKLAGPQQVLLRCTVAEVSKAVGRKLGINGWLAGNNVRDVFAVNQIDAINPMVNGGIGLAPTLDITGNGVAPLDGLDFGTNTASPAIPIIPTPQGPELSIGFPRLQMQLFIRALRDNSLLRVLAEPNLVAMSGREANFLAGGEFPVPIPAGLGTTTIEWREFGVRLRFTPTVIGRQMVRLNVAPEVSERDFANSLSLEGGTVVPGLTARSVETTIELPSGSTIAIGGLLSEQFRGIARNTPGLGDVPVLGALFRSVDFQKSRTELVVLVTPELVGAMHPDQVSPMPGQDMLEPSDWELFGLAELEGKPPETDEDELDEELQRRDALETPQPTRYRKHSSPPDQMSLHGPWGPAHSIESLQ